jgi:HSP20 family molecular chaperone IbpA
MSRSRFDWTEDVGRLGERFDDLFDRLVVVALPAGVDTAHTTARLRQDLLGVHLPRPNKELTIEVRPEGKTTP